MRRVEMTENQSDSKGPVILPYGTRTPPAPFSMAAIGSLCLGIVSGPVGFFLALATSWDGMDEQTKDNVGIATFFVSQAIAIAIQVKLLVSVRRSPLAYRGKWLATVGLVLTCLWMVVIPV